MPKEWEKISGSFEMFVGQQRETFAGFVVFDQLEHVAGKEDLTVGTTCASLLSPAQAHKATLQHDMHRESRKE